MMRLTSSRRNKNKLAVRKDVNRQARKIRKLRKEMRQILDSRLMGAKTKRRRIDELNRQMSRLSAETLKKYGGSLDNPTFTTQIEYLINPSGTRSVSLIFHGISLGEQDNSKMARLCA